MSRTALATPVKQGEVAELDPVTQLVPPAAPAADRGGLVRAQRWLWELFYHLSVYVLAAVGTACAWTGFSNVLAVLCIALAMQQAGWIGHDYGHGRGPYQRLMGRSMSGLVNAFSPTLVEREAQHAPRVHEPRRHRR